MHEQPLCLLVATLPGDVLIYYRAALAPGPSQSVNAFSTLLGEKRLIHVLRFRKFLTTHCISERDVVLVPLLTPAPSTGPIR